MKSILVGASALGLAFAQFAAVSAYAAEPAAAFRTVSPQKFSSEDLQRYGMNQADADRGAALQKQGYQVMVLNKDEAERYKAGISDKQWLLLGILAGVIVIAVAISD